MEMFERATSKAHGYLFCDGKQDTPESARFRTDLFYRGVQKTYVIHHHANKKKTEGGHNQTQCENFASIQT